jgi:hypothetical protein
MKKGLPTRKQSIQKNIREFSALSPSQKIRALEKQRKALAYLKTLTEVQPGHEVTRRRRTGSY